MFTFKKNIIFRFNLLLIFFFAVWALIIIAKSLMIMTLERQFWLDVAKRAVKYNRPIEPRRGNILGDNGELLVSDLVKYRLFINFNNLDDYNLGEKARIKNALKKDSVWTDSLKGLCEGLARIAPYWSAAEYERHLKTGLRLQKSGGKGVPSRYGRMKYPLCPDHELYLSYTQYKQIMQLPIMRGKRIYSGVYVEEYKYRKKFFGSLASSTLGDHKVLSRKNGLDDKADRHGIDEKYDSLLKGVPGLMHIEKEKTNIIRPVEQGLDVQTTLNIEMQDICEQALREGLAGFGSKAGWVILMEVKTGDIKAIVNLSLEEDGQYVETFRKSANNETPNHAIADLRQPGSIFKPIALAIALEDGKIKENDSLEAHKSIKMHGRTITDAVTPLKKTQTVTEVLQFSSNVGMALIINEAYKNNPKRFTDRLVEFGMKDNFYLLNCESTPSFRTPENKYWSPSDLQAMSRGYGVSQTALNMITFYNTIANGGVRMAPRLVKAIQRDGNVIEEFEPQVLNDEMLSSATVESLKRMLTAVVNGERGTGKRAKSDKVSIAGKTGTALDDKGNLLSFCGFFPVENPEYTCIVQNINNIGGGGSTSAVIFKEIAEKIMANKDRRRLSEAVDTLNSKLPYVKAGNMTAARYVLDEIDVDKEDKGIGRDIDDPTWGKATSDSVITLAMVDFKEGMVPNVKGMGAKDAVYLMKRAGMRVSISGHGKVTSQSVTPGTKADGNRFVKLILEP